MEPTSRSLLAYVAAYGLFLAIVVIWAVLALLPRVRRHSAATPPRDGHFLWAQSELAQIAEARNPVRREADAKLSAALMRADLEVEVGRIISEVSDDRRESKPHIGEAVARGLGMVRSYGLMQRRLADLENVELMEGRLPQASRFQQLRRVMEVDESRAPRHGRNALVVSRGR